MRLVPKVALAVAVVALMAVTAPAALAKGGKKTKKTASAKGVAGWIYIDADSAVPNKNSVLAIPYAKNGVPNMKQAKQFPSGGTGTGYVTPLPNAAGTATGDHQVVLSSNRKLLFAVNQGSNSVAVFHVNSHTGALTGLKDFYSGGLAPIALGYAHGVLVVANHGIIAPFNPLGPSPPGPSDLVSFRVSPSGGLHEVSSTAPDPDGLIDANINPAGNEIVSTGFFPEVVPGAPFPTTSPQLIRSVSLSSSGALNQLQAFSFPQSWIAGVHAPPFIPPALYGLPFGVAFNPTAPYVYVNAAVIGKLAVYNYSNPSNVTLTSSTDNLGPGGSPTAACWTVISKNGKFLYTANSVTQNISVFSLTDGGATATLLEDVPLKSTGTDDDLSLDPTGKWLYIIGEHDDIDAPRPEGIHPDGSITPAPLPHNYLDSYKVNQTTGNLTEISTNAIPVPTVNLPYGVATLTKG
jgi:Lactonase, 7-bladed beta-propeller